MLMHRYVAIWRVTVVLVLGLVAHDCEAKFINTMPGCNYTCVNSEVEIPYPFGIGKNCYHNSSEHYEIICKPSNTSSGVFVPFLRKFDYKISHLYFYFDGYGNNNNNNNSGRRYTNEINLEIGSGHQEICTTNYNGTDDTNNNSVRSKRRTIKSDDLTRSPFTFLYDNIQMVAEGCPGHVSIKNYNGSIIGGCSTICEDDTNNAALTINGDNSAFKKNGDISACNGLGCCSVYSVSSAEDNYFEVELSKVKMKNGHNNNICMNITFMYAGKPIQTSTSGVVWTWKGPKISDPSTNIYCFYGCRCSLDYKGNPYLPDGCQLAKNSTVNTKDKNRMVIGFSSSLGTSTMLICFYGFFHVIRRSIQTKRKAEFFKRNGGLLLQQQIMTTIDSMVKVFSDDELQKATDNFNTNRILGQGGQGIVYKGMLLDGRIIAIKKSLNVDESQIEKFINEVVILSQISHHSVVKLLGCCLETEVPLLVYEFIPNGTLSQHIHDPSEEFHITWKMCLQIAAESAGALAYLHSASGTPIYHRDIKSSNILLDDKYRAKVADFGTSRTFKIDQTHLTTLVQGTMGYMDPEYFQTNQFTEKSDVYSFGVVLVELLTGQKPLTLENSGGWKSLTMEFLFHMETSRLFDIIDLRILDEAKQEEILTMANLAKRCLKLNGKHRPTMKEVASVLEGIRSTWPAIADQINSKENNEIIVEMEKMHDGDQLASSLYYSENDMIGPSSPIELKPLVHYTI